MSAFCVFGMTLSVAKKRAEKKLEGTKLSLEQWNEAVGNLADEILQKGGAVQVSPTFDAPQFAAQWIEVAKKTSRISCARVMVRKPKVDKHGNPVMSKVTGLPRRRLGAVLTR